MALSFQPKDDNTLRGEMLWPEGIYDFTVTQAEEKTSNSGNPMIVVDLLCYGDGGKTFTLKDYLMVQMASLQFKVKHFCDSTGLLRQYNAGSLSAFDCEGVNGQVRIGVQPAKGEYGPKNAVKDYVVPDEAVQIPGDDAAILKSMNQQTKPQPTQQSGGRLVGRSLGAAPKPVAGTIDESEIPF